MADNLVPRKDNRIVVTFERCPNELIAAKDELKLWGVVEAFPVFQHNIIVYDGNDTVIDVTATAKCFYCRSGQNVGLLEPIQTDVKKCSVTEKEVLDSFEPVLGLVLKQHMEHDIVDHNATLQSVMSALHLHLMIQL